LAWSPIIAGIVILGFFPGLIFNVAGPAVEVIARTVGG
jgi:hypothetical protein